jgi:two-component sensor histidine kinase
VRVARAFVGRLLGPSYPCRDVAVLLVSEMVTNSLLHGGPGPGPEEAVTVTVVASAAGVRVEVTGRKANGVPVLRRRTTKLRQPGLRLVGELAVRWGYERGGSQATTWFELRHG